MLKVRPIPYGSLEYEEAVALRDKILRAPLGLKFDAEFLAKEKDPQHVHVGAFTESGRLVGCLIMTDLENGQLKIRQVAVDSDQQGRGVGRAMDAFAERSARERSFREIVLTARESAVPFYLACGYEAVGEVFIAVTIPHREMRKLL